MTSKTYSRPPSIVRRTPDGYRCISCGGTWDRYAKPEHAGHCIGAREMVAVIGRVDG